LMLNPFVVVFGPVSPPRMAHEIAWAEEFAERGLRVTAPIIPGSRPKSTTRGTYLPPEAPC
jgi:hypothetical protein